MLPKELGILETVSFIFVGNTTLLVLENTVENGFTCLFPILILIYFIFL